MASVAFPRRLFDILSTENPAFVSWNSDGKSFRINDTTAFCNEVLPRYFRHCKLTSFQRQLNLYGFQRVHVGPLGGAYHHPLFTRDNPSTLDMMKRTVRKGLESDEGDDRNEHQGFSNPMNPTTIGLESGTDGVGEASRGTCHDSTVTSASGDGSSFSSLSPATERQLQHGPQSPHSFPQTYSLPRSHHSASQRRPSVYQQLQSGANLPLSLQQRSFRRSDQIPFSLGAPTTMTPLNVPAYISSLSDASFRGTNENMHLRHQNNLKRHYLHVSPHLRSPFHHQTPHGTSPPNGHFMHLVPSSYDLAPSAPSGASTSMGGDGSSEWVNTAALEGMRYMAPSTTSSLSAVASSDEKQAVVSSSTSTEEAGLSARASPEKRGGAEESYGSFRHHDNHAPIGTNGVDGSGATSSLPPRRLSSGESSLDVLASQATQARVGQTRQHFSSSSSSSSSSFAAARSEALLARGDDDGSAEPSDNDGLLTAAKKRERRMPPQPVVTTSTQRFSGPQAAQMHPNPARATLASEEPLSPSLIAAAWALSADTLSPPELERVIQGVPAHALNVPAYEPLAEQLMGRMGAAPALSLTLALLGRSFACPYPSGRTSSSGSTATTATTTSSSDGGAGDASLGDPDTPTSLFSARLGISYVDQDRENAESEMREEDL